MTWTAWAVLGLAFALPWVISVVAAIGQGIVHRRLLRRSRTLSSPARRWLEVVVRRSGLATRVEVHAALAEAYFPHVDTVGLSPRAADSAHPVHRAMVAHELGHATTAALHPALRTALPMARLATDGLPFAAAAAVFVGAHHTSPWMLLLGFGLVALTVVAHGVVLLDEGSASLRAWRWLDGDAELTATDRGACRTSMIGALSAYAAPLVGWLGVLAAAPWLGAVALSGGEPPAANPVDATGTWLLLLLAPFLLLHAGLVIAETVRPDPIKSSFHLELRQQRVHQWGFTAGICALLVAIGVSGWGQGAIFELALAMAVFTGLEPATVLLRALLLIPVLVSARLVGLSHVLDDAFDAPETTPDAPPQALANLWEHPPWFLRGARLLQLGWVPLIALVLVQAWVRVG